MKIITEQMLNLGDAGQHPVTIVGQVRSSGIELDCLVNSVTVTAKGSPDIDIWPLLKTNPIAADIEEWLISKFHANCKSVSDSIREMEYRDRMQHRMECDA